MYLNVVTHIWERLLQFPNNFIHFFSPGGKQYQRARFQQPLYDNGTISPSRHGKRRAPSPCTPPSGATDISLPPSGNRDARQRGLAARSFPHGPSRWRQKITSRQTRPQERHAATGKIRPDRGAEGPGSSSVPSALCLQRGLRLLRAESGKKPVKIEENLSRKHTTTTLS